MLRAVAGLDRPRAGRIALGSEVWFDRDGGVRLSAAERRVGYLPQDYGLFPHLSVAGNVRFAARRDRPDLLARLGITHLAGAHPHELSGGERQRAALARALAREPRVLLLDEPFAALDDLTRRQVREELADLLSGLALPTLVVTHSFEDAAVLAQRVGVIDRGILVALERADDLVDHPASATVAALTGANVLEGDARPVPGGSRVLLRDGGELTSSMPARGRVDVVVQPWKLELVAPGSSALNDTVVSVRSDRGRLQVRLTRFRVDLDRGIDDLPVLVEGEPVGLRAQPEDVLVLGAAGASGA